MESEDRELIEKRFAELSGYLLGNIYFTNAIAARIIGKDDFTIVKDDLENIKREFDKGVDKDPYLKARNEATKFYLFSAINDIELSHLNDEKCRVTKESPKYMNANSQIEFEKIKINFRDEHNEKFYQFTKLLILLSVATLTIGTSSFFQAIAPFWLFQAFLFFQLISLIFGIFVHHQLTYLPLEFRDQAERLQEQGLPNSPAVLRFEPPKRLRVFYKVQAATFVFAYVALALLPIMTTLSVSETGPPPPCIEPNGESRFEAPSRAK